MVGEFYLEFHFSNKFFLVLQISVGQFTVNRQNVRMFDWSDASSIEQTKPNFMVLYYC